jgi:hypothetical protein
VRGAWTVGNLDAVVATTRRGQTEVPLSGVGLRTLERDEEATVAGDRNEHGGSTPDQADATYRRAERILLDEADAAFEEPALPLVQAPAVVQAGDAGTITRHPLAPH